MEWLQKIKAENIYLFLAISFGLVLLFVVRPGGAPDEVAHLYRSFQIAQGDIIGEVHDRMSGGWLPKDVDSFRSLSVRAGQKVPWGSLLDNVFHSPMVQWEQSPPKFQWTASLYSPAAYLPQTAGIIVGKSLDLGLLPLMYIARFLNMMVAVLITYFAIRATPAYRWGFFVLATTPMVLFMNSSVSADAFTNAIGFLIIALGLRCGQDTSIKLTQPRLAGLILLSALLTLSKSLYVLIPMILVPLLWKRLGRKKAIQFALALGGCCVASHLIWSLMVKSLYVPVLAEMNPAGQMEYLKSHPFALFVVWFNTLSPEHLEGYLKMYVGVLGWLDIRFTPLFYVFYPLCLLLVWFGFRERNLPLGGVTRTWFSLTFVTTVLMIFTALYLTWTSVGASTAQGFQGRYLIPIVPLLLLSMKRPLPWGFTRGQGAFAIMLALWSGLLTISRVIDVTYL